MTRAGGTEQYFLIYFAHRQADYIYEDLLEVLTCAKRIFGSFSETPATR